MPEALTCVVLDDDPLACDLLAAYVGRVPTLALAAAFTDPLAAFAHLQATPPGLLLTDIELPGLSGLELVRGLRQPPPVVFLTSHPEYALPTYEADAVDFLVKPLSFPRFLRAVDKALRLHAAGAVPTAGAGFFFIRTEQQYLRLHYADVAYVEALGDFVKVHLLAGPVHVTLVSLKHFEEQLPPGGFVRVHRSFLVNTAHIHTVTADEVGLAGNLRIPLGQHYRDAVLAAVVQGHLLSRRPGS